MPKIPDIFRAHGGEDTAELEVVIRLQSVKRWHMIDTTRQQTLAEHTANVAMLAWHIAGTAPGMYFGDSCAIVAVAMMHDVAEVFMGDIPTHTKRSSPEMYDACKSVERWVTPSSMNIHLGERIESLVKACDLADGIRFIRTHGIGATAKHADNGLTAQIMRLWATMEDIGVPDIVIDHVRTKCEYYVNA